MCPDAIATAELFRSFLWSSACPLLVTIAVTVAVPRIVSAILL